MRRLESPRFLLTLMLVALIALLALTVAAVLNASEERAQKAPVDIQKEGLSRSSAPVFLLGSFLVVASLFVMTGFRYQRVLSAESKGKEGLFRATFEQAAAGIAIVSTEGRFLHTNNRFCEIVGYTPDEMLALTFQDITHPDDLGVDLEHVNRLLNGEITVYSLERRYRHQRGHIVWVNLTVSLLRDEQGAPRLFVAVVVDVTEKKKLQEERDRVLVLSQDLICIAGTDGYLKYLNPAWEANLGYTREELLARPFVEFVHKEDHAKTLAEIEKLAAGQLTLDFNNRYIQKDGTVRHIRWVATPLPEENLLYCIGRDVTLREAAEEGLRKSEQRFRSLMEQSPMGIEILTPDGQISEVNAAWLRLWDVSEEEAAQVLSEYNFITDGQSEKLGIAPLVKKAFAGEAVVLPPVLYDAGEMLHDIGLEHIKATTPWVQCHLYPVKNADGEVIFVVNTYIDITERKEMETELAKSEAHLLRAQEVAKAGSWELDILKGELYWSAEVYRIFGVPQEEPSSYETFLEMVVPEEREYVNRCWRDAMHGEPYDLEHRIIVDGQVRWLWEQAEVDFDEDGRALRGVGIVQDITERKRAEEQLREHQERLRALAVELTLTEERERQRIATELHDGAAQSLALARIRLAGVHEMIEGTAARREVDEASQTVRESLEQIRSTLLDLSSPSLREIGFTDALSQWLEEVVEKKHRLLTDFVDECGDPPMSEDLRVILFRNTRELLSNVMKHAEATRVTVRMSRSGQKLRISVEDDGVGFDPATAPNGEWAFGHFSVRERMSDLGGSLEVVSAPGQGCIATLVAPLQDVGRDERGRE